MAKAATSINHEPHSSLRSDRVAGFDRNGWPASSESALPPLPLVRSLAYFLPVIEELRLNPPDLGYLTLLRARIATST